MSTTDSEACIASWCSEDEWCSVACTAHLIGKKWHPVIVHRLLAKGPLGFNALLAEIDELSSTVLSSSLQDLEENGLVDRNIVCEKPVRVEYALTEQGATLRPVIDAMDAWGESYLADSGA